MPLGINLWARVLYQERDQPRQNHEGNTLAHFHVDIDARFMQDGIAINFEYESASRKIDSSEFRSPHCVRRRVTSIGIAP